MKLPISDIKPNPSNPRLIKDDAFKKLVQSLKDFPEMAEVREVVVNKDHVILGGNMRYKAMKEAGWTEVPVKVVDWPEEKQREFIVKDNVSGGEWDWDSLANQYEMEELDVWGLDLPEQLGDQEVEEDETPEVDESEPPKSKLGEVYQLGRHRVMCGDSTDGEQVAKLMGDIKADMVFTDPPYDIETEGGKKSDISKSLRKQGTSIEFISNFNPIEFLAVLPDVFKKGVLNAYIFCNKQLLPDYLLWARDSGYSFNVLVWKKPNAIPIGDSHRPDIEYLLLFRKNAIWNNGLSHIVNYSRLIESPRETGLHPTMKPIAILTNQILISSQKGSIVVDLFLGSGSTLIACEQTDRTCYGMELDPKYCDVIRKRYAKFVNDNELPENWEELTPVVGNTEGLQTEVTDGVS